MHNYFNLIADPSATDLKLLGYIVAPIVILIVVYFGWGKIKKLVAKVTNKEPEHEATS